MDNLPTVKENGLPVSTDRIDPAVASFIAQMSQTAQLVKMRKLEESKVPIGEYSKEWPVTDRLATIDLDNPWIAFTLSNDGTGDIQLRINRLVGSGKGSTIKNGESAKFDFGYPIVKRIYLVTSTAGTTATVRIRAIEGSNG